jgi:hypothetical protein
MPTSTGLPDLQRLAGLESLLTAIERWFEVFHATPNALWIGTPFGTFTQYGHCTILLFKLSTLDEPGWDKNDVKKRADLLEILERLAARLSTIPQEFNLVDTVEGSDSGLFFKGPKLIRGMRASFSAMSRIQMMCSCCLRMTHLWRRCFVFMGLLICMIDVVLGMFAAIARTSLENCFGLAIIRIWEDLIPAARISFVGRDMFQDGLSNGGVCNRWVFHSEAIQ